MVLDCVQICLFSQFVELISLLIIQPQGLEQTGNGLFISGMNKLMDSLTDYNKICVGICSACDLGACDGSEFHGVRAFCL